MLSNSSDTYYGKSHHHCFIRVVKDIGVSNLAENQLKK